MTLVFQFPGQSSRYPGMIEKIARLDARAADLLQAASDILHRDLAAHYRKENEAAYARNRDVQIGVFLANQMFLAIVEGAGVKAPLSLGLSLGEYSHLVHIGALSFRAALLAVDRRGQAYDEGPRGSMASVFPIAFEELEEVARRARSHGVVEVTNLNSPKQQVLSGETAAVEEALRILEAEHYVNAVIIERQVPMHSSLFAPVGERFRSYLTEVPFERPRHPYLPNRLGRLLQDPDPATFISLLSTHVHQPVLWRQSIDHVIELHPDAVFLEVGPMAVLTNLLDRKWHAVKKLKTDSSDDTAPHLLAVIDELRAGAERGGANA
jgi:[acyl-carrier-protein] S-malonyltransferase